jgi:chromatin remodeling complex protein RSC6
MAKKSTTKKTTTTEETNPVVEATPVLETTEQVTEPVVVEKKKRKTKKTTEETPEVKTEEVKTEEVSATTETTTEQSSEAGTDASPTPVKKKRRVINKQDLAKDLDNLTRDLFENVKNKELLKRVKQFKSDIVKILKLRNLTEKKERDISNSGFMKPVGVSEPMRAFLELKPEELTRRLDITKRLCEYIKVNDLQDPRDRRNIVPDKVLRDLLNMTESEPHLTYYSIQQKLKDHIIKI